MENGVEVAEVRAIVSNFSEATKTLGAMILEGRIRHDGDPVATWAIGNVVGHYDLKANVFPQKERAESKIDPAIALMIAISVWIRKVDPWAFSKNFADDGVLFLRDRFTAIQLLVGSLTLYFSIQMATGSSAWGVAACGAVIVLDAILGRDMEP